MSFKIFSLLKNKRTILPRTNILAKSGMYRSLGSEPTASVTIALVVPPGKQTPGHCLTCLPPVKPVWSEEQEAARRPHPPHLLGRLTRKKSQPPAVRKPQGWEAKQCPEPNMATQMTCQETLSNDLPKLSTLGTP